MSSINDRDQMRRIIKYGATDYMVKPFSIDEMVIHIEHFLQDHLHVLLKEKDQLDTRRNMILGSIQSLLSMQEVRDPWLKSHADRVAHVASGMLTYAGANKQDIETVTLGSQLHDIGKIALRDDILFNPRKLSEEEFALYKQHPRVGSNILEHIPYLPSDILSIVFFHHEQPDGKGYPVGLGADEIPEHAAIAAVADRYVVLTEAPPYGKGLPPSTAIQLIESKKGTELGQQPVDLLLEWIHTQKEAAS
jgi:HD-GYP domain-containing protein (c-di-GMP phosphodiesterase class II)